jgi:hypothetical protein
MSTELDLLTQLDSVLATAGAQTWAAMKSGLDFSRVVLLPGARGYSVVIMPASVARPTSNEQGGSSVRITYAYRLTTGDTERNAFATKLSPAIRSMLLHSTWALGAVFAVDLPDSIEVDRSGNVILASGDWLVALT